MSNQDIINFIEETLNVNINDTTSEVNDLLSKLIDNKCSIYIEPSSNFSVNGIGGQSDIAQSTNYTFLIPNLFRLCYVQDTLKIPNICNLLLLYNRSFNFLPLLIDEKLIKSFLYFNFPVNISYHKNLNQYVNNIKEKYNFLLTKKRLSTYGSYTEAIDIFIQLYSTDSMIFQLLELNRYINVSNNANTQSQDLCNFKIIWDFTAGCNCPTTDFENGYIFGNFNYDYYLSQPNALNLYKINSNLEKNTITQDLNDIFTILNYTKDIFEDILLEIQYFLSDGLYCRKDYMLESNLPELFQLYNKFYNNQLESISRQQPFVPVYDVVPSDNSILEYIKAFIYIYNKSYKNQYLTKSILLNGEDGNDAIVIFSNINFETTFVAPAGSINYYYYYLNNTMPSPIELFNSNSDDVSTYTNVKDYAHVYNNILSSDTDTTYNIVKEYPYDGLYPDGGTTLTVDNLGIIYSFLNSSNVIKYLVYETLETYVLPDSGGKGVSLIYFQNPDA